MDYQVNFISKLKKCNESDFKKNDKLIKLDAKSCDLILSRLNY